MRLSTRLAALGGLAGLVACDAVPSVEGAESLPSAKSATASTRASPAPTPVELPTVMVTPRPHPLAKLTRASLVLAVQKKPGELGSLSIGEANRGALYNGVQMPPNPHWEVVDPDRSWATQEAIDSLRAAILSVVDEYPNTPKLFIGDMSKPRGGYFRPHRSHQSGRDVDLGYYYLGEAKWYRSADAECLDRQRTWSLVKALLTQGTVEYIFMDRSVQDLLEEHALRVEPDPTWVRQLFSHPGGKVEGTVRHVSGHKTHMHVRFYSDEAREASKRAYRLLARFGKI